MMKRKKNTLTKLAFIGMIACLLVLGLTRGPTTDEVSMLPARKPTGCLKSERELFELENPYVPYLAYQGTREPLGCDVFPSMHSIVFENSYWQIAKLAAGEVKIFSAHYDNRTLQSGPTVHILAQANYMDSKSIKCHLWTSAVSKAIVSEEVTIHYEAEDQIDYLMVVIISCKIPQQFGDVIPISVSISDRQCSRLQNNVRVYYSRSEEKKGFAICSHAWQFEDDRSRQVVEWLEINRILGAEKFSIPVFSLHSQVVKALEAYVESGVVEIIPITYPEPFPNTNILRRSIPDDAILWRQELIPIIDCYMRNMHKYQYVLVQDFDEIIVPRSAETWKEMMQSLPKASSLTVKEIYFWDNETKCQEEVPCDFFYLQRTLRSPKSFVDIKGGGHRKSFHNTDLVVTVYQHGPGRCFGSCWRLDVPMEVAQLQHYRKDCRFNPDEMWMCKGFRNGSYDEKFLWRYKDQIVTNVRRVLENTL